MNQKQINFDFDLLHTEESSVKPAEVNLNEKSIVESMPDAPLPKHVVAGRAALVDKKSTRGRMKLSDMKPGSETLKIPDDAILFERSYYSISSVAEMFSVNQSLIRFWENEFDIIKPKKNAKGDRLFRPEDIKNLQLIYHLLREKKFTIEGAKDFLKKNKKADERFEATESLKRLRSFLVELKSTL